MLSFTQLNEENNKIRELSSVLNYLIENKDINRSKSIFIV